MLYAELYVEVNNRISPEMNTFKSNPRFNITRFLILLRVKQIIISLSALSYLKIFLTFYTFCSILLIVFLLIFQ